MDILKTTIEEMPKVEEKALGIFRGGIKNALGNKFYPIDPLVTISKKAFEFVRIIKNLKTDKENLPQNYIASDLVKWAAGMASIPVEWSIAICENFSGLGAEYTTVISDGSRDAEEIKILCREWAIKEETASNKVRDTKYFIPEAPPELSTFSEYFWTERELNLMSIGLYDIKKLLAYGYRVGVRNERARRKRGIANED